MSNLGDFIRKKRTEVGRSGRSVANSIGVSASYFLDIERGTKKPTYTRLEQIRDELFLDNCDSERLFDLAAEEKSGIPEDVSEYIRKNPYIIGEIRMLKMCNAKEDHWQDFTRSVLFDYRRMRKENEEMRTEK